MIQTYPFPVYAKFLPNEKVVIAEHCQYVATVRYYLGEVGAYQQKYIVEYSDVDAIAIQNAGGHLTTCERKFDSQRGYIATSSYMVSHNKFQSQVAQNTYQFKVGDVVRHKNYSEYPYNFIVYQISPTTYDSHTFAVKEYIIVYPERYTPRDCYKFLREHLELVPSYSGKSSREQYEKEVMCDPWKNDVLYTQHDLAAMYGIDAANPFLGTNSNTINNNHPLIKQKNEQSFVQRVTIKIIEGDRVRGNPVQSRRGRASITSGYPSN